MTMTLDQTVADLQRTNAELQRRLDERTNERDEALAQQAATADVLQLINRSPGDLTPVFDAILEKAHNLCSAPLGSLVVFDGKELRAVATRGYSREYDALARQGGPPHVVPAFDRLLAGEQVVQVSDARATPADTTRARAAIEMADIRSMVFVPLPKDDAVLGYISAQRQEVRRHCQFNELSPPSPSLSPDFGAGQQACLALPDPEPPPPTLAAYQDGLS
jgi:transcriptional regulator with GAF, ATPase, and Fis domain